MRELTLIFIGETMAGSKLNNSFQILTSVLLMLIMTGCSIIGGIFKMGVAVGVFLVVALIVVIIILAKRFKKRE